MSKIRVNKLETLDGLTTKNVEDLVDSIDNHEVSTEAGTETLTDAFNARDAVEKIGPYIRRPRDEGAYYSVDYSSDREDLPHYGFTANVKRTGGNRSPVAAQLNAYDLTPVGEDPTRAVFGIASEAWSGDFSTEPENSVILKPLEPAIISQFHSNDSELWGVDIVFKNRADAQEILHGSVGDNQYNKKSEAIHVSSQSRSSLGEYCGWNKGINFSSSSLDMSVDGGAIGIDMASVPFNRLDSAIRIPDSSYIKMEGDATNGASIRFLGSTETFQISRSGTERIGFDLSNVASPTININQVPVVGERITGWVTPAGNTSRGFFDTSTVSLEVLATVVGQLVKDLKSHGLIGA